MSRIEIPAEIVSADGRVDTLRVREIPALERSDAGFHIGKPGDSPALIGSRPFRMTRFHNELLQINRAQMPATGETRSGQRLIMPTL